MGILAWAGTDVKAGWVLDAKKARKMRALTFTMMLFRELTLLGFNALGLRAFAKINHVEIYTVAFVKVAIPITIN